MMESRNKEFLEELWESQAELNKTSGFDTMLLGSKLKSTEHKDVPNAREIRREIGISIKNYIDALNAECHELRECLNWKHWYKEAKEGYQYEIRDLQNARVEVIDMLFFWVSISQLLGLSPDDIIRMYRQKYEINLRRQSQDRRQDEHHLYEEENKQVE